MSKEKNIKSGDSTPKDVNYTNPNVGKVENSNAKLPTSETPNPTPPKKK